MKKKNKEEKILLRIEASDKQEIKELARDEGKSISEIVREMFRERIAMKKKKGLQYYRDKINEDYKKELDRTEVKAQRYMLYFTLFAVAFIAISLILRYIIFKY